MAPATQWIYSFWSQLNVLLETVGDPTAFSGARTTRFLDQDAQKVHVGPFRDLDLDKQ